MGWMARDRDVALPVPVLGMKFSYRECKNRILVNFARGKFLL